MKRLLVRLVLLSSLMIAIAGHAYAGAVVIDGTDANEHGFVSGGQNRDGWLYMQKVLENLAAQVPAGAFKRVVVLGTISGTQARNSIQSAFDLSTLPGFGWQILYVEGASAIDNWLTNLSTTNTGILYIPTFGLTGGDLTIAEMEKINLHAVDIANFVNGSGNPSQGGALFAMGEDGTGAWGWLQDLIPGLIPNDQGGGGVPTDITLTPDGMAAFPGLTNADLSGADPWHVYFDGDPGSLKVLGVAQFGGSERNVILGGGAGTVINPCSFDTEPPMIASCPRDIVQPADANECSAVVNYPVPTATDNCSSATIICIPPSGQRLQAGTSQTVICTATDAVGNTSECSFKISVRDDQPPTIVCPTTAVQINAAGACTINVPDVTSTVRNSVSDACTPASSLTITQSPAANSSVGSDLRAINVTVTDGAGVSTSCNVPVAVINSGGQAAQVTIGSGNELDLSVRLLGKTKKKKKVKPAVATGTFSIKNVKCDRTSLTLPFGGVRRVTDAGSGKPINDVDDNDLFSVFVGCGATRTKLNVGQNLTIGFNDEVCLTVEFNPTIPAVASSTNNLSASEVLPDDFKSEVVFDGINPVMIRARVDSGVKLINPATGDPNDPVVTICDSGNNQFTVRYHVWSPSKADVQSVKYEFLNSSGGVIKTIDVDLAGPLSGTSLVDGQSFNVEQSFSGTGVSAVRITLTGGGSSVTATSGSISSSCSSAIQLLSQRRATLFLPGLTVDAVKP